MTYRNSLIFLLLFISIPIAAIAKGTSPQSPPLTAIIPQQDQTNQPTAYVEIEQADLSTPKKTASSFVDLFNRIVPPTKADYLEAICTRMAIPSYKENCLKNLKNRLNYLKSIHDLKGATFKRQPPTQISKSPMKFKATWQEDLSFFDGTTKINHKAMTFTLQKSGKEWKILRVKQTGDNKNLWK